VCVGVCVLVCFCVFVCERKRTREGVCVCEHERGRANLELKTLSLVAFDSLSSHNSIGLVNDASDPDFQKSDV